MHFCLPGVVDTWNARIVELLREQRRTVLPPRDPSERCWFVLFNESQWLLPAWKAMQAEHPGAILERTELRRGCCRSQPGRCAAYARTRLQERGWWRPIVDVASRLRMEDHLKRLEQRRNASASPLVAARGKVHA